jgi:hypothetical protein
MAGHDELAGTTRPHTRLPLHLRARLQCGALPSDDLDDAFGREVHVDKAGRGIGDLVIFRDLAVAELHDRDALEHRARPLGLGQRRAIAEGVARIERVPVADRRMHVPAKIRCRAIEPVVNQLSDFRAPGKRAVKRIMIDPVFGEQLGQRGTLVLFDGVTKDAEHGGGVHSILPESRRAPRKRGIQYSGALRGISGVAEYWIVRVRGR